MPDIKITPFNFQSTTVEYTAVTDAALGAFAEFFGPGVVSVKIPKSQAPRFEAAAIDRGLRLW